MIEKQICKQIINPLLNIEVDYLYLAISIDGYDQEKLSYLKRVESKREVVANNPVKAELEVNKNI